MTTAAAAATTINIRFLFLIGVPNSGKSTQAALFGGRVIAPGAWLRELSSKKQESDLGAFVFYNWSHEALTPLVTDYLDKSIGRAVEMVWGGGEQVTIVIDGFPRNKLEAESLPALCRGYPFLVVELVPGADVASARGKKRQRGDDDTAFVTDIRNESYEANIERIKEVLARTESPICELVCGELTKEEVNERIVTMLDENAARVPIPPTDTQRHTLARKMFMQARPIDSAIVVQKSLKLANSPRLRKQFFGTHPISLTRVNVPRLRSYPYLVALKATGVRYMCLVHDGRLCLMSRTLDVYVCNKLEGLGEFNDTLLDGELIGQEEAAHFLVLDCLAFKGQNCTRNSIIERLRKSLPLGNFMSRGPLFFRQQEYVDRSQLALLLQRRHELPWKVDGIILQPARLPYRLGIDYNMFKWKPLGDNTADFYYNESDAGLYCRVSGGGGGGESLDGGGGGGSYRSATAVDTQNAARITVGGGIEMVRFGRLLPSLRPKWLRHAMIIECAALPEHVATGEPELRAEINAVDDWGEREIVWVPQHHRADKSSGNIDWVAQSVIQSIVDNITQEELERECLAPNMSAEQLPRETARLVPHATRKH